MLDEILPNKDGEGYRLAADGNPLELVIVSSLTRPTANDIMNEVVRYWADVGIKAKVDIKARSLMGETANSNEAMSCAWTHDTTGFVFTAPQKSAPVAAGGCENNGPAYARWYQTDGKQGIEPSAEMKRLQEIIEIGKTSPLAVGDRGSPRAVQVSRREPVDHHHVWHEPRRAPSHEQHGERAPRGGQWLADTVSQQHVSRAVVLPQLSHHSRVPLR